MPLRDLAGGGGAVHLDAHAVHTVAVLVIGHTLAVVVVGVGTATLTVYQVGAAVVFHAAPVVVGVVVQLVAVDVITAGHRPIDGIVFGIVGVGHTHLGQTACGAGGPRLVVVVHHVDLPAAGTAVAAVATVVNHTVAHVHVLGLNGIGPLVLAVQLVVGIAGPVVAGTAESGRTVAHMHDHVVVERGQLATPDAAVAVGTLAVAGIVQTLTQRTPL